MKKQKVSKLNLSKKQISKLEASKIDKLKGGSASACNTCWDCWWH